MKGNTMKRKKILYILFPLLLLVGCNTQPQPKQFNLAEKKITHTEDNFSNELYSKMVNTKGYKTLRLFVHIYNDDYKQNPLPQNSNFTVHAYYGIGRGSWGYFSKTFPYKSTSGWGGVVEIPVVGEKTRISIYGKALKNRKIEVDVAGSLF